MTKSDLRRSVKPKLCMADNYTIYKLVRAVELKVYQKDD